MKENAGKIIGILVVITGIYITLRGGNRLHDSLLKNRYFTTGTVKECNAKNGSSTATFTFIYSYKGKDYRNYSYPYDLIEHTGWADLFTGKTFTVVVDTTNPANSDMLLTKEKFKEYSCPYPDSLHWIIQYLK